MCRGDPCCIEPSTEALQRLIALLAGCFFETLAGSAGERSSQSQSVRLRPEALCERECVLSPLRGAAVDPVVDVGRADPEVGFLEECPQKNRRVRPSREGDDDERCADLARRSSRAYGSKDVAAASGGPLVGSRCELSSVFAA